MAIILHSFIDGLTIGVFKEGKEVGVIVASVIIHKVPVACTVGTTFKTQGKKLTDKSTLITFITFILSSPIGIVVGMAIGDKSDNYLLMVI
mmetsp:Transcript_8706/g.13494  ORF Transcript_8706/g.13494 Transcript_8706/m.13494 type:complete len:91 (+) Transcript_8706:663-935(+)